MKMTRLLSVLILLATLQPTFADGKNAGTRVPKTGLPTAKPAAVGMSAERLMKVTPAMRKFVIDKKIAGAVAIVARKGKVVYFESVGKRDIKTDATMTKDTIFRFYSMSKPITSVGVMMLVDAGKLKLDDPVSKHLTEFKSLRVFVKDGTKGPVTADQKREMTVRDLLRHTSGLTYGIFGNSSVDKLYRKAGLLSEQHDLASFSKALAKIPLQYQPGTKWLYSISVDLQGRLIEAKSGMPFGKFLRTKIFKPLKMRDTAFYVPKEKLSRFATNYGPDSKGGLRVVDHPSTSKYRRAPKFESGGGGLVSTAADYIRFCQMLLNGGELDGVRILKAETVKQMTRNQLPKAAYPIGFGLAKRQGVGFGLGFSVVAEKIKLGPYVPVGEYGWGGAASTHFWISPKDGIAVVVLTQHMPFNMRMKNAVKPLVYQAIESKETSR